MKNGLSKRRAKSQQLVNEEQMDQQQQQPSVLEDIDLSYPVKEK
jgi:hypothetical protein